MRKFIVLSLALALTLPALGSHALATKVQAPGAVFSAFIAAFNAQDADALLDLVAEDVQMQIVSRGSIQLAVDGFDAFRQDAESLWELRPDLESAAESVTVSGDLVAARVHNTWTEPDGTLGASTTMEIYEIRNGRIQRVYGYPVSLSVQ